jgi:hypothetical protein
MSFAFDLYSKDALDVLLSRQEGTYTICRDEANCTQRGMGRVGGGSFSEHHTPCTGAHASPFHCAPRVG